MKNKFLLSFVLTFFSMAAFNQTIDVSFEAVEKGTIDAVQMDSIYVGNINRDTSTTLYYPNFSLTLCNEDPVSAEPIGFAYNAQGIKNVYPNPFNDYANIVINNPESKQVRLSIYNLTGTLVAYYQNYLVKGEHMFQVSTQNPGMYMVFLNDDKNSSYKIMSQSQGKTTNAVRYVGIEGSSSSSEDNALVLKSAVTDNCFTHFQGDTLLVEGYADCYSNVIQYYEPTTTETYVLEFELADNIAPTLETSDITVYLDANGGVSVSVSDLVANAIDNCGIADTTLSVSDFSCSQIGTQSVDVTLTDEAGNSTTLSAQVTVLDNILPILTTQAVSIELDENGAASIKAADVVESAGDNCSIADTTLSQSEFACEDLGTQSINVTVVDVSGNSTSKTAEVTIQDNIAPALVTKAVTVELDGNGDATITADDVIESASDNCTITSEVLSQSDFNCSDVGTQSIDVTVTDNSGNSTTVTAEVTVEEKVAPSLTTKSATLKLNSNGVVTLAPKDVVFAASDNCLLEDTLLSKSEFSCEDLGSQVITVTLVDKGGNETSSNATVTIQDRTDPYATPVDFNAELDETGEVTITEDDVLSDYGDNCSTITPVLSETDFNCADMGDAIPVTITLTDDSGNETVVTSNVTVVDNIAPELTVKSSITVVLDVNQQATIEACDVVLGTSDNCSSTFDTVVSPSTITATGNQDVQVNVTLRDESGNETTEQVTVHVIDNITDVQDNVYDVVQIGEQAWMAENMRATEMPDGTPITLELDTSDWEDHDKFAVEYCYQANDPANLEAYGALYTWAAAVNSAEGTAAVPSTIQGVCPTGWHIPSDGEWEILAEHIRSQHSGDVTRTDYIWNGLGPYLKSTSLWSDVSPNTGSGTNDYGFNALPGGDRNQHGVYYLFGESAIFWSATVVDDGTDYHIQAKQMRYDEFKYITIDKIRGINVRCVMDEE